MKNESTSCNLLRKQQRFANLFIQHFSSFFGKILSLAILLMLIAKIPCQAADFLAASEDSWRPTGLFCFRTNIGTNDTIHLFRYENGKFERCFEKEIGHPVGFPVCFTNGVVVASSDGTIRRLDLQGKFIFVAKLKGFEGLARETGRVDNNHIFMVGQLVHEHQYRLYTVDISGAEPVLERKYDIIEPWAITRSAYEIIIVGATNVLKVDTRGGVTQLFQSK